MIEKRNQPLAYVRSLYEALEDLRNMVNSQYTEIPNNMRARMAMADIALMRARKDGINKG